MRTLTYPPLAERQAWYDRLHAARARARLGRVQLVEMTGITRARLDLIFAERDWPDEETHRRLARALDIAAPADAMPSLAERQDWVAWLKGAKRRHRLTWPAVAAACGESVDALQDWVGRYTFPTPERRRTVEAFLAAKDAERGEGQCAS